MICEGIIECCLIISQISQVMWKFCTCR